PSGILLFGHLNGKRRFRCPEFCPRFGHLNINRQTGTCRGLAGKPATVSATSQDAVSIDFRTFVTFYGLDPLFPCPCRKAQDILGGMSTAAPDDIPGQTALEARLREAEAHERGAQANSPTTLRCIERHREVLGKPPRIAALREEEFAPEARA